MECAPAGCTVEARGVTNTHDASVPHDGASSKALAVWLNCIDARSLTATRAAFAQHPEWVSS
jgi:hypothetical protein